jgi:hypothetical protein
MVHRSATVFVYVGDDGRVDGVEFANPARGLPADDQVCFRGIDLFGGQVEDVVREIEASGTKLSVEERGYSFTAYDLVLALWRNGEPSDDQGMPLYFESALIAAPGYYD